MLSMLAGLLPSVAPAQAAAPPVPAPVQERTATTVTADALPTAQVGTTADGSQGVVWALKIVGNTVYAGGAFANAAPAGADPNDPAQQVPRSNLLAFDLTTGELTGFAPVVNGTIRALAASPDGSTLYVGGSFTSAAGQPRSLIAAFDTQTGALISSFNPILTGTTVNSIAVTSSAVYVGGWISAANGVSRRHLVALDPNGQLLSWAPIANYQVDSLLLAPTGDKLVVAGRFDKVSGVSRRGMAAVSLTDGKVLPWAASKTIKNGLASGPNAGQAGISSLSTDGQLIYGSAWNYSVRTTGNLEGTFALEPAKGAIRWIDDCHGDIYSTYSDGTNVYLAGHPHDCESVGGFPQKGDAPTNMRYSMAVTSAVRGTLWRTPRVTSHYSNWSGYQAPAIIDWFPNWMTGTATGQGQATWAVAGSGDYVVFGGEFPQVNDAVQQGLVRFARPNVAGAKQAPRLTASGSRWVPTLASPSAGTVRLTIPGNWDRDNVRLTYTVLRKDVTDPVYTTSFDSFFWSRPTLTYVDRGLVPGRTYTYQVVAVDADGNEARSKLASIVVGSQYPSTYAESLVNDGVLTYVPMDGQTQVDALLGSTAVVVGGGTPVTSVAPILNAQRFTGQVAERAAVDDSQVSPDTFTTEIWFRTTGKKGGKLLGFGSSETGDSKYSDRHLYLSNKGRLSFGIMQNNKRKVLSSSKSYRDGRWHQAVATLAPTGAALYVDGKLVASSSKMFNAEDYYGYWRVGGDDLGGWPVRGSSEDFVGDLAELSIYGSKLTAAQVRAHYLQRTGTWVPVPAIAVDAGGMVVTVDAGASSAGHGTVVDYSWDFGDGTAPVSAGATTQHTYVASGTYVVTLTTTNSYGVRARTNVEVVIAS